ncbi:MAG TPA: carbamoyl-phosphate synthase large subunit [Actinomycetota bacterium]|nr:carbamoyl-phosphate synthase large subunit [Actinomycetota bacterium]
MPRRDDIETILILGSGPIVIGQAAEFDYSGTQACKVLREDGFRVVLVNSNPATIMTDPEFADRTYVEPVTPEVVEAVIERERPQALLPTLGGQTALNCAVTLSESGVLDRYGVELIGAKLEAIKKAEDRSLFKDAMQLIGLECARSGYAYTLADARNLAGAIGYPVVVRPSFILGGAGSGVAHTPDELEAVITEGLERSPVHEVLVEESLIGWKEFEFEVMRDLADNVVIVCSIENLDPMGVHTGDSITVAPAQTLTDREYQAMRNASIACIREVGVETGGSNIQFAVDPATGRMIVIEMNPRVSRSSALASKATGFPIAKVAAKLAAGYLLEEIPNDITRKTPASFEPSIDYVVVKIPRFTFEKFAGADPQLTTKMKSVGESMAIGRTFAEALQKGIRSLETGRAGLNADPEERKLPTDPSELLQLASVPTAERLFQAEAALREGATSAQLNQATGIDPWFCDRLAEIVEVRERIRRGECSELEAARNGFTPDQVAYLGGPPPSGEVNAVYKGVDSCAAEFEAYTPYYYSTYGEQDESNAPGGSVVILGSGPNRIGQGIEFDYCCVHAAFALREIGVESVMVNCNPETVSTDYDTSSRLYFEPLTFHDVMQIVRVESPAGVIVQLGGQTPLKLAMRLEEAGVKILGTQPDAIDAAEDRGRFGQLLERLRIPHPPYGMATSAEDAVRISRRIGYPVLVRPSYVLGGRAMEIVYSDEMLERYIATAALVEPGHPVLVDKFLEDAVEIDVDAIYDGSELLVGGILEHIEEAGIHSGDSACVIPPHTLGPDQIRTVVDHTKAISDALGVRGLINVQYAVRDGVVHVIEANPRASRTVPFCSKVLGVPLAKVATWVMLGRSLEDLRRDGLLPETPWIQDLPYVAVKEAVMPFSRFPGVDTLLGPEMRSTGEVMGIDAQFGHAFAKAEAGAGLRLPTSGAVFISVRNKDKRAIIFPAKRLSELGFDVYSTEGTADVLRRNGVPATPVAKIGEGKPDVLDLVAGGKVDLVINTPIGRGPRSDGYQIRTAAVVHNVPCITTISGVQAAIQGIEASMGGPLGVAPLQDYHRLIRSRIGSPEGTA